MMGLFARWKMRRDEARAVAAYRIEFGLSAATLVLLQGKTRRWIQWYGSADVQRLSVDRIIGQLWLDGYSPAPDDPRTRRLDIAALTGATP